MRPLWWMAGASVASWLAVTATVGSHVNPEMLAGMLGPLVAVSATWIAVERTYASNPERVTGVMIVAFAAKMVFFGVYVAVLLRPLGLRLAPFIVSFTGYFIALYLMEALFLRRLFMNVSRSPSR